MTPRPTDSLVAEFHEAFGQPLHETVRAPNRDLTRLRARLIREEYEEVMKELEKITYARSREQAEDAIVRLAKELADLRYVIDGAALTFGIDHEAVFREVHRSNMSKLGPNGEPIYRFDGKVQKGPGYRDPDVRSVLRFAVDAEAVDA